MFFAALGLVLVALTAIVTVQVMRCVAERRLEKQLAASNDRWAAACNRDANLARAGGHASGVAAANRAWSQAADTGEPIEHQGRQCYVFTMKPSGL